MPSVAVLDVIISTFSPTVTNNRTAKDIWRLNPCSQKRNKPEWRCRARAGNPQPMLSMLITTRFVRGTHFSTLTDASGRVGALQEQRLRCRAGTESAGQAGCRSQWVSLRHCSVPSGYAAIDDGIRSTGIVSRHVG